MVCYRRCNVIRQICVQLLVRARRQWIQWCISIRWSRATNWATQEKRGRTPESQNGRFHAPSGRPSSYRTRPAAAAQTLDRHLLAFLLSDGWTHSIHGPANFAFVPPIFKRNRDKWVVSGRVRFLHLLGVSLSFRDFCLLLASSLQWWWLYFRSLSLDWRIFPYDYGFGRRRWWGTQPSTGPTHIVLIYFNCYIRRCKFEQWQVAVAVSKRERKRTGGKKEKEKTFI